MGFAVAGHIKDAASPALAAAGHPRPFLRLAAGLGTRGVACTLCRPCDFAGLPPRAFLVALRSASKAAPSSATFGGS
eukprot:7343757-Alexandrium_andersonii.AAC.1